MKIQLPGHHASYQKHRKQFWLQIFLPILVTTLPLIAVAVMVWLSDFEENGEVTRWAAISTIWLVIPLLLFGILLLALIIALVYLLAMSLKTLPIYSEKAQYYVNRGTDTIKQLLDMAVKPVLMLEGLTARIKVIFGKK